MLRSVSKAAYRIAQEVVVRFQNGKLGLGAAKQATKAINHPAVRQVLLTKASRFPAFSRNLFLRTFQRTIRSSRLFLRPFAALHYQRLAQFQDQRNRENGRFRGLYKIHKRNTFGVVERIRDVFGTNPRYNKNLLITEFPDRLDGYDIGNHIACGCSAAVYELRKKNPKAQFDAIVSKEAENISKSYPLALKVMFNYDFNRNEKFLWDDMGPELVPLVKKPKGFKSGRFGTIHTLPRNHPNVIKLHTAFVDVMPILPGAENLYPEALPFIADYIPLEQEPKTLFIVMKRYRMTLRDYMATAKRNYWTARVMYGQLLEAIVFLHDHKIAHRDMKSDNVLLDFNHEDEVPHLVLSDFGSALANNDWEVKYEDDLTDLGGNLSLRAPEVRRARPGAGVKVNFSMSDTWAAATLGYEIFTRINPFYSRLNSENYVEDDLPQLPRRLHYAVKDVTYQMLKVDPTERPLPHVAANVVSISLFRFGQDVKGFLEECGFSVGWNIKKLKESFSKSLNMLGKEIEKRLDDVTQLYAAETIASKFLNPRIISDAELQLRATFLSRMDKEEVWNAMEYFFDENSMKEYSNPSSSGSSTTGYWSASNHAGSHE